MTSAESNSLESRFDLAYGASHALRALGPLSPTC